MSDLNETRDPEREPQIDTVGWLFLAVAVAITAAAAMVAYNANDTMVATARSPPSTEGKSVSGLDELIQGKSIRSVPAHSKPGWQVHPSTRTLVARQPAPHCKLPGLEPGTVDVDLWSRLKLDYEQHCYSYKRTTMLVRRKLRKVAEAIIGHSMRHKVGGAKAAVPNAVAPSDNGVAVQDTAAAPTVVGPTSVRPTSTGTVSASSPPLDAKLYRESAIAAYRNGDLALALVNFDRAIRLDPSFEDAYIDRSIVLYRLGALNFAFNDVAQARGIENSHRILMPPLPRTSPLSNNN